MKVTEGYYCEDLYGNDFEVLSYGYITEAEYNALTEEEKTRYEIISAAHKKDGKWHKGEYEPKVMEGVKVTIEKSSDYPTPYGTKYKAKGFYMQKNYIVIVGNLDDGTTTRVKYPAEDVKIKIIWKKQKT